MYGESEVVKSRHKKSELEDFFVAVSAVLTILQMFDASFETPAFFSTSLLIIWMIYDKVPWLLNRRFSDKKRAFTNNLWLRMGLVVFPFAMFLLFTLNIYFGFFLLPESLLGINGLDIGHSIFGIIALVFVSIYYFSWRLWKYPKLAKQLWKMTSWTETEFEKEQITAERSRVYSLTSKYLGPGIVPMAVCTLLFLGWLVLSIIDVLMVGLLLFWLFSDLIRRQILRARHRGRKTVLEKWDDLGRDLLWKAFARAGIASLDSVLDTIMLIFAFMIIVLLAMIGWSAFIGVIILLNGWYILFVLFQIGLRSSARVRIQAGRQNLDEASFVSLPRGTDLIMCFSYVMIVALSLSVVFPLGESFRFLYMFVAIILNVGALATILYWWKTQDDKRLRLSVKNQQERIRLSRDLLRDRYRLYATVFFLGLPVVAASGVISGLVLWSGIVGGLTLLCFGTDFRKRVQRQKAGVYASLLTAYVGTGIFMILGTAMYALPELKTFLVLTGVLFIVLLVIYWVAIFRVKRRWKWNDHENSSCLGGRN